MGDQAIVRLVGGRTSFVGRLLLQAAVRAKRKRDPHVRSGDVAKVSSGSVGDRLERVAGDDELRLRRDIEQPQPDRVNPAWKQRRARGQRDRRY